MSEPPLHIDYWASLYSVYTDYAEQYNEAMRDTRLVNRAESLWGWKGLNRSVPFEKISPTIKQLDRDDYLGQAPQEAIELLSNRLIEEDVVGSKSLVTSAFLLHLMASGPDQYSSKFPIYDRRVWNAYIYLWRIRTEGEQLYSEASQSTTQYARFCQEFCQTCPNGKAQDYERALFMFGGFIGGLPPKDSPTPIKKIDEVLESQEDMLANMQRTSGYALIDLSRILESGQ